MVLPDGYKDFLWKINGSEGMFNQKNYAILWRGEYLQDYNCEYQVEDYLEDMILFGSDGGGEAFAFDKMKEMIIVRVPFIGMERELAIEITDTFTNFLSLLYNNTSWR
ncbi:SMI1/KNR4 family protein [Brucepastera parasyntrophica]|uniref:SMI1/KNR4 family protein n=1 Tax=Brucepastera parasyntrophica TaxID=2880008 RepID=UPI003F706C4A